MANESHLKGRANLVPTINVIDELNEYMTALNKNECKTYVSSNKCVFEGGVNAIEAMHTPRFLPTIRYSGFPNHELKLKVGCSIMLIRNIDHSSGLCDGMWLIITRLGDKVIEAKLLNSNNCVDKVFILRMTFTPLDVRLPFRFQKRQFSVMLSYAMTINKIQEQSLEHVRLLRKKSIFIHGQLYVAISRVRNKKGLKFLIAHDENTDKTENVVYPEVFRNIRQSFNIGYSLKLL
ncbi:hypothetical protein Ahy_B01g052604 [Arachis hypogaea]|uniref:DNA helicase Pif1-like 2B domain-containing protein n=2 Tax=Arachis TaxID=3817 RepID=A0A445APW6_ARAHY|nr:hypothetical protein Ahy_B01g052604 [Arachis hypogaea]